jgi:hypothetical protein
MIDRSWYRTSEICLSVYLGLQLCCIIRGKAIVLLLNRNSW